MPDPATPLVPELVEPIQAVELIVGVARLGEADLAGWWSSQGMNPSVSFALAGFRRTAMIVGAELALLTATRRHHEVVSRETAVHLFSPHLPFASWARSYLAEQKTSGISSLVDMLREWRSTETAFAQLEKWRQLLDVDPYRETTVSERGLRDPDVVSGLFVAFVDRYLELPGKLVVPYVDLAR